MICYFSGLDINFSATWPSGKWIGKGSIHEKWSHLYTHSLGIGPYLHILFFIGVYKRMQNMSAVSQARVEKS